MLRGVTQQAAPHALNKFKGSSNPLLEIKVSLILAPQQKFVNAHSIIINLIFYFYPKCLSITNMNPTSNFQRAVR